VKRFIEQASGMIETINFSIVKDFNFGQIAQSTTVAFLPLCVLPIKHEKQ